jgi:hypothetical protein
MNNTNLINVFEAVKKHFKRHYQYDRDFVKNINKEIHIAKYHNTTLS